jgi:hypothetical protein
MFRSKFGISGKRKTCSVHLRPKQPTCVGHKGIQQGIRTEDRRHIRAGHTSGAAEQTQATMDRGYSGSCASVASVDGRAVASKVGGRHHQYSL